ncbi:ribosome maturation factor RimP [Hydrogenophaga sp.]|jgi:ribosome maturation factor RimP|uniref:ribosome maturation factor RimP n=1 Tax=Hydrogenophaga sp. TaxID=1904254 RepID=UPI003F709D76
MAWQETVEQTVTGLGLDLVELERSAGGLLRVTIDYPWEQPEEGQPAPVERFVTVEDCEKVTRQLHYLLEVEGLEYRRLEVGSPGIDRPLKREIDYVRFEGHVVDLTLKAPIGVTGSEVAANRKKFRGTLERADDGVQWQVVWSDAPEPKPGQRVSKKRAPVPMQAMQFSLGDVQQARLAPIVDFKGRKAPGAAVLPQTDANDGTQRPETGQANRKGGRVK